jgi:hypothetical protein
MRINYNVTGARRKELVKVISAYYRSQGGIQVHADLQF